MAIEVPHGAMVEGLIERGFGVFAVNPKQLDRFRDRHTVAGSKDDRRDAYVLADSLRTDRPLFRRLKPEDPLLLQLREMSRLREDLVEQLRRLCNQLRQQLHRYYPQVLSLSPAADDAWVWDLLELAPIPASVARLSRVRVQKVLRTHRIRRLSVEEVLTILRAPTLPVAPASSRPPAVTSESFWTSSGSSIASAGSATATWAPCWIRSTATGRNPSIVASPSFSPCPGSEDRSPPRCSPRPTSLWSKETTPRCAPCPAWLPSPDRVARAVTSS